MTNYLTRTAPVTCTCALGEFYSFFDAVLHHADCALMVELEARISGDLIPAGRVRNADVAEYRMEYTDERGWFLAIYPGVNGEE